MAGEKVEGGKGNKGSRREGAGRIAELSRMSAGFSRSQAVDFADHFVIFHLDLQYSEPYLCLCWQTGVTSLDNATISADAIAVQEFLKYPLDRLNFDQFFKTCYHTAVGYLRYLKARGFQLPTTVADVHKDISDLAIDILGGFLQSKKDRPFFIIYDFFKRKGMADFDCIDQDKLYRQFSILLRGYIRKELGHLFRENNPQIHNLKRRFKDIFNSPEYTVIRGDSDSTEYIHFSKNADYLRSDCRPVLYDDIIQIAEDAYNDTKNRKEWCNKIFEIVDSSTDLQNFVRKQDLISAIISVNERHVEIDGMQSSSIPWPDKSLLRTEVDKARKDTLNWAKHNIISDFVTKKRISSVESGLFLSALEKYLIDFGYNGDTDPIPEYYREVMPRDQHKSYLKDHKYVFETIIRNALEDFKRRLRNNSIIVNLGCYYMNGME